MAGIGAILLWISIVFGVWVLASYVGTKLALRSYFEHKEFSPSDIVKVRGGDEEE